MASVGRAEPLAEHRREQVDAIAPASFLNTLANSVTVQIDTFIGQPYSASASRRQNLFVSSQSNSHARAVAVRKF